MFGSSVLGGQEYFKTPDNLYIYILCMKKKGDNLVIGTYSFAGY